MTVLRAFIRTLLHCTDSGILFVVMNMCWKIAIIPRTRTSKIYQFLRQRMLNFHQTHSDNMQETPITYLLGIFPFYSLATNIKYISAN